MFHSQNLYRVAGVLTLTAALMTGCATEQDAPPAAGNGEEPQAETGVGNGAQPQEDTAQVDPEALDPEVAEAFASLSPADREAAMQQGVCPVSGEPLGSMGTPQKITVEGREVFICCEGCDAILRANPEEYLAKLPEE